MALKPKRMAMAEVRAYQPLKSPAYFQNKRLQKIVATH
jgi:hypothetical protein